MYKTFDAFVNGDQDSGNLHSNQQVVVIKAAHQDEAWEDKIRESSVKVLM